MVGSGRESSESGELDQKSPFQLGVCLGLALPRLAEYDTGEVTSPPGPTSAET